MNFSELGKRISQRRTALGLTIETCSKDTGISRSQWTKIESGSSNPRTKTLLKICNKLDVAPELLMKDVSKQCCISAIECVLDKIDVPGIMNNEMIISRLLEKLEVS